MRNNEIVMLLIDFFRDEYADDPKGVEYWFHENSKGDIQEFRFAIDQLKQESEKEKP